jgi:hypothetical protein
MPLQMTGTIGRHTRVDSFAMLAHSLEANVLTIHNFVDLVEIIPDIRGAGVLPLGAGGHGHGLGTSTSRSSSLITSCSTRAIGWSNPSTAYKRTRTEEQD